VQEIQTFLPHQSLLLNVTISKAQPEILQTAIELEVTLTRNAHHPMLLLVKIVQEDLLQGKANQEAATSLHHHQIVGHQEVCLLLREAAHLQLELPHREAHLHQVLEEDLHHLEEEEDNLM